MCIYIADLRHSIILFSLPWREGVLDCYLEYYRIIISFSFIIPFYVKSFRAHLVLLYLVYYLLGRCANAILD